MATQPPEPVSAAVRALLTTETRGIDGEVRIDITPLDAQNTLQPCAALQAFLPPRARAWGQVSVGVSCNGPAGWTIYLAARVSVFADYLITARPLKSGQSLAAGDVRRQSGDLTALPENLLRNTEEITGMRTRYAVAAGQPVHGGMVRQPAVVRQGQDVRVITLGPGFQVSHQGRALNNAGNGESARVRMPNGRVLSGTARPGGVVEIPF